MPYLSNIFISIFGWNRRFMVIGGKVSCFLKIVHKFPTFSTNAIEYRNGRVVQYFRLWYSRNPQFIPKLQYG